ncbi:MAG: hypothetical protein ACD_80C00102G0007 [uncultured bacterium (gcode 4)]|uniref:Rubredoxin-like domain-containing protein n=1 Tax=uncultured bacterium (gcode 4) TaxID=1234023 RepID=K1X4Z8_9BACT|nr:MAG: hypothetical protein ACD_80C00102G0007 [uncultured bacterium (gcode 4)]
MFLAFAMLPLLFVITFVNTEHIFQNNFFETYTLIYWIYLLVSLIWLLIFKRFKFKILVIKHEWFSTIQFIFYTCILVLPAAWLVHYFILWSLWGTGLYLRSYGKVAFVYLVLSLSISPLLTFIKNKKISDILIVIRKVIWILSFIFFLKHGLEYFSMEYLFAIKHTPVIWYRDYVRQNFVLRRDALTWVVAWILMVFLWVTSNTFSIRFLWWALWKRVQSLVYPAFLITCIHIAFSSRFDSFYILLIIWLVSIRTLSYLAKKDNSQSWPTTKYICIPCGYIYDQALGDPDGWIAPWTRFENIPDSRVCPICGVSKLDFEPYYEVQHAIFEWYISTVMAYVMLTKDILELTLKVNSTLTVLPWQYILLCLRDFDGEFTRAYSVVENVWNTVKLWIKLKDTGRWWRALKKIKIWDTLKIKSVHWEFVLKNTSNPKVFIATWTGLSPIYNMIISNASSTDNILFFWASTQEDLFYMKQLRACKNLQLELFLSQENVKWYHYGRIDITGYDFPLNTEFYVCWHSDMVIEQMKNLKSKWYKNVYVEIF